MKSRITLNKEEVAVALMDYIDDRLSIDISANFLDGVEIKENGDAEVALDFNKEKETSNDT